jgi:hypothetical protein
MRRPDRGTVQRTVKAREAIDGVVLRTSDLVAALQAATGCSRASAYRAVQSADVSGGVRRRARRPRPEDVGELVHSLARKGNGIVLVSALLDVLIRQTGCSRATAYRAFKDALASGVIGKSPQTGQ